METSGEASRREKPRGAGLSWAGTNRVLGGGQRRAPHGTAPPPRHSRAGPGTRGAGEPGLSSESRFSPVPLRTFRAGPRPRASFSNQISVASPRGLSAPSALAGPDRPARGPAPPQGGPWPAWAPSPWPALSPRLLLAAAPGEASFLRPDGDGAGGGNPQRKVTPLGPGHPSVTRQQTQHSGARAGPGARPPPLPLWSESLEFGVCGAAVPATGRAQETRRGSPLLSAEQEHPCLCRGAPGARPRAAVGAGGAVLSLHGQGRSPVQGTQLSGCASSSGAEDGPATPTLSAALGQAGSTAALAVTRVRRLRSRPRPKSAPQRPVPPLFSSHAGAQSRAGPPRAPAPPAVCGVGPGRPASLPPTRSSPHRLQCAGPQAGPRARESPPPPESPRCRAPLHPLPETFNSEF